MQQRPQIAVVIPCYRVRRHILGLIASIGPEAGAIYVVDDACPEATGDLVESQCTDSRVRVIRHPRNLGVGGAVITGYRQAIDDEWQIIVKLDGDGQMDPALVPILAAPVLRGEADYCKGNRFFDPATIHRMPLVRRIGNLALSFMSKISTGYWDVFDPTNGFTAIHRSVAARLPLERISERYFFESDMLFRLNIQRAVVMDMPMEAVYGDERSNLRVQRVLFEFLAKHARNAWKRIVYNYFLRDLSIASVELLVGLALVSFSILFGAWRWHESLATGIAASPGTVMLAGLTLLMGVQLLLAFLSFDIANVPRSALHKRLEVWRPSP